jgi:hypothetical protein
MRALLHRLSLFSLGMRKFSKRMRENVSISPPMNFAIYNHTLTNERFVHMLTCGNCRQHECCCEDDDMPEQWMNSFD